MEQVLFDQPLSLFVSGSGGPNGVITHAGQRTASLGSTTFTPLPARSFNIGAMLSDTPGIRPN
jgi:hypothetical protein